MPPPPSTKKQSTKSGSTWKLALVILSAIIIWIGYNQFEKHASTSRDQSRIQQLVHSEELILHLTPKLKRLSRSLLDLQLPRPSEAADLFTTTVAVEGTSTPSESLDLWQPELEQIIYFDHAAFKIVNGHFLKNNPDAFESTVAFSARARSTDHHWLGLSAKLHLTWSRDPDNNWRISTWKTNHLESETTPTLLFSEALDRALPREGDRFRARRSIHEEESALYFLSGRTRALSHDFAPIAMNQKPAVSVVDIDNDGFDDIYIMVRLGQNLLLHNQRDGTFVERAVDRELAIAGNSTCGLFADFDNDGDPDLFLGRSVKRALYLENTGAWFREKKQPFDLPYLAVSMAAADYNNDGLLDLYIATYRPEALGDVNPGFGTGNPQDSWPERFLPAGQAAEFHRRYQQSRDGSLPHRGFFDQVGPPDLLLVNRGAGQFEPAPENTTVGTWKNTLQPAWSDIDNDGDQDLYLAHDWAPDHLFRNDGPDGFTDITRESNINPMGFGMGASWGDYDGDGRQDLYVSNMFSKAGQRILSQFSELDPDYLEASAGNVLYHHNADGTFTQVSGLAPPKLTVAKSGWSWGGQFADFDNDTDLDLYALAGYFTAPRGLGSDVDL